MEIETILAEINKCNIRDEAEHWSARMHERTPPPHTYTHRAKIFPENHHIKTKMYHHIPRYVNQNYAKDMNCISGCQKAK